MACRTISELGLHGSIESSSDFDEAGGAVVSEADLLHSLLCCCIGYEGIWCLYLGRPVSIPTAIMDVAASRCHNRNGLESLMHTAWVGLCIPMAEITGILNKHPETDLKIVARLLELDVELGDWYDTLPPRLTYHEMHIADLDATAYGLHMQYCKVRILMQQAFIKASALQNRSPDYANFNGPLDPYSLHVMRRQVIYQNAIRITRLLLTYRQIFGVEEIPSVMLDNVSLAATCLITHLLEKQISNCFEERDMKWLRLLLKTLVSVQIHFPVSKRILSTLKQMTDGTPLQDVFSTPMDLISGAPSISRPDKTSNVAVEEEGMEGGVTGMGIGLWSSFGIDAGTSNLAFNDTDVFPHSEQLPNNVLRNSERQWMNQQSLNPDSS